MFVAAGMAQFLDEPFEECSTTSLAWNKPMMSWNIYTRTEQRDIANGEALVEWCEGHLEGSVVKPSEIFFY